MLGHRRIVFLGGIEGNVVTTERIRGHRAALDAAGIAPDPSLIVPAAVNPGGGIKALRTALALERPPTAALCFSDVVAFGVLDASAAAGLKVGRDFSVIGFDDVAGARHTCRRSPPSRCIPRNWGGGAAAALLRCIADPNNPPEEEILAPSLIVRGTCGPVPTEA